MGAEVIRREFFGWRDREGKFHVSRYPADAPVRPSITFDTIEDVDALMVKKRARVHWWPPLPDAMNRAR